MIVTHRFARHATVGLFTLTCLATVGCDVLTETIEHGAEAVQQDAQAGNEATHPATEDEKLGEKLAGYITCINDTSSSVRRARDRYADWVDVEKGPSGKERNIYGIFEIRDQKECREGVAASKTAQPSMPDIEAAADAYIKALDAIEPVVATAYKYYDEDNYKDDAFTKGLELHPKLVEGFKAFNLADQTLRTLVKVSTEGLLEREVAHIEQEEGRKLRFLTKNIMILAKKLMAAADAEDFESLDLEALKTALTRYEAACDEYATYAKAHKTEANSISSLSWFDSAMDDLKKDAKTLVRRKRDNKPWTNKELSRIGSFGLDGHPTNVSKKYNELVGKSNGLNWTRYAPE